MAPVGKKLDLKLRKLQPLTIQSPSCTLLSGLPTEWMSDVGEREAALESHSGVQTQKWRRLTGALGTARCNLFHWQNFKD